MARCDLVGLTPKGYARYWAGRVIGMVLSKCALGNGTGWVDADKLRIAFIDGSSFMVWVEKDAEVRRGGSV